MVDQNKSGKNSKQDDKKEQILYRVVRIIIIFAIVWIIGTKFSSVNQEDVPVLTSDVEIEQEIVETDNHKYTFRNEERLAQHYEKHGIEMGFSSEEKYEEAASAVVNNPKALHKLEEEDGDDVYYIEDTKEFVIVSKNGYIRTYYYAEKDYFDRQ